MQPRTTKLKLEVADADGHRRFDPVAVEEPLEIKLVGSDGAALSIATVLRTPGHDFELVAGFLFAEGLIRERREIRTLSFCEGRKSPRTYNSLVVDLSVPLPPAAVERQRLVVTHGGCGACSSPTLASTSAAPPRAHGPIEAAWLRTLPAKLASSPGFASTGGMHAAALVPLGGQIERIFEDVGRHNAVDKLVGSLFLEERLPPDGRLLLLSGRAGFELVQKAAHAGIAAVASLGAPTTLSVQLAQTHGLTLVGFLSERRFNVYAGALESA